MNADQIAQLEKQVITNLPEEFWEITDQSTKLVKLSDKILYSGAIFAAVFQLICLIALIVLPALGVPPDHQKNLLAESKLF